MKVDSPVLGGGGLGGYMADSFFSEDDSSLVSSSCHFSLCNADESSLSLFGGDSDDVRADYSWDNCFGNLEDVDTLLSSDPDSAFGRVPSSPSNLRWADPASPLDLQSESELSGTKSSSIIDAEPGVNEKADIFDLKMDFVPINTLSLPCGENDNNATFHEAEFQPATSFESSLHNSHVPVEQQSHLHSGAQVNSSDCLVDEKMMEVLTGSMPTPESNGNISVGMDVSEDEPGPSSVSVTDSEKVKVAQVQRARRHAVTRKRLEERSKRQLSHRKSLHGAAYGIAHDPQVLHPMHMPVQAAHLYPASNPLTHNYSVNPPLLLPLQPMHRPVPPYMHVGYNPMHVIPQATPPAAPTQVPGQRLYVGYQQPCAFPHSLPPHQQHQLRPAGEIQVRPPPSTPTMTPREKIEKLKYLQQMHARLAVEQQGQQFAAQGISTPDAIGLRNGVTPMPPILAAKDLDMGVNPSESQLPVSESDFEPSLSVGQTSVDGASDDEGGSLEAAVLDDLQNTIKTLELGTRMCIRDALYRLARSAMKRQASSGRPAGDDGAKCSQVSQETDATSTGLEASINSDPSSSSRVSRMDMTMVETHTNPIDRTIAHLLFHKMQSQPNSTQMAPNGGSNRVGSQQTRLAGQVNGHITWNQGSALQGNWATQQASLNPAGGIRQGTVSSADVVSVSSLPPSKVLPVSTHVSRSQDASVLRTIGSSEQQSGIALSGCKETVLGGHLQDNVAGASDMSGNLTAPIGSQLGNGTDGELRAGSSQTVTGSSHMELGIMENGFQRKRLQHAACLKELTEVLDEDLDVGSAPVCGEESELAQSGPPVSTSSGSDERQASGFSNHAKNLVDEETPMDETI